jgi:hypothetical protein
MLFAAVVAATGLSGAAPAAAQWLRVNEQFYLPAGHNWYFRRNFPAADRLFNAFDYGHAILYERLYRDPNAPASELEEKEYDFITRRLLVSPPRLPLEESAIETAYVRAVPEAKAMFEWAHVLHRQIYDVLADERLSQADKDGEVQRLLRYYRSRPELAFSSTPKNMELMEGQYYSTAFRNQYPKFNGLIWGYHWLQVGLYEPLMLGRTQEERQTGVVAAVARFRQMLENAPEHMPRVMPMTAAIAPTFAARYPEAAIIFDNLHAMHDVISDILASDSVSPDRRRAEIVRAAQLYRDDTSFVMSPQAWLEMSLMMGANNMGGPVLGFLAAFPEATLQRGAVMAHGGHGQTGESAQPASAGGHAGHAAQPAGQGMQPGAAGAQDHAGMQHAAQVEQSRAGMPLDTAHLRMMTELHRRMMADPVIRERVAADPALSRLMSEMHGAREDPGAAGDGAARLRALDFAARLLSDPAVQARVHSDPELHRLWADPEVQRRIRELRGGAATPAAAGNHEHP